VCDGYCGMIAAVKLCWPEARMQRCLVPVVRIIRTRITTRPKTEAGRGLYQLAISLFKVHTRRQKRRWIRSYCKWEGKYQPFLAERSYGYKSNGKKTCGGTITELTGRHQLSKTPYPTFSHTSAILKSPELPTTWRVESMPD
jgi:hypothetical protein